MKTTENKEYWQKMAGLYSKVMRRDTSMYREICVRIRSYLNRKMNVLELEQIVVKHGFIVSERAFLPNRRTPMCYLAAKKQWQ